MAGWKTVSNTHLTWTPRHHLVFQSWCDRADFGRHV